MTRLVRPAPISLAVALVLALFLALALSIFPASPANAQEVDVDLPRITIQPELRPGETNIPQGAAAVFVVRRSGDTSGELVVRLQTWEPLHQAGFGVNPTEVQHTARFRPGDSVVVVRAAARGDDGHGRGHGPIWAQVASGNSYRLGDPYRTSVWIRDAEDDDVFVTIAADDTSIDEGESAGFTLTRTGSTAASLTARVSVSDPGEAMRGNHWDDAPEASAYRGEVTFAANESATTVSFQTRPNVRDTGDLVLTASALEDDDFSFWVGAPFSAGVTVTDDDTAPEFSVSVSEDEIYEGEDLTFTVTRHNEDTLENYDALFKLRVGPNYGRYISYRAGYDSPENYSVIMPADQESVDLSFQVIYDRDVRDFRYEAEFVLVNEVPEERFGEYVKVRGERKVGAAVHNQAKQEIAFISVGEDGWAGHYDSSGGWYLHETFYEGQQVPFTLLRTGTAHQIAEDLEVRVRYYEVRHPYVVRNSRRIIYNPSEQNIFVTFPAGETRVNGTFNVLVDDVDEPRGALDLFSARVRPHSGAYRTYLELGSGVSPIIKFGEITGVIEDNPRAVSIDADDDDSTITEGETAEFTLTRLGPTDEALTVNVAIDDPGHFRRGDHGRNVPDSVAAVTFAAGSGTAALSVPTRDDTRDIPNDTLTVTIPPSQDDSYRPAEGDEGASSASVTVTDNDVASKVTLSVPAAKVEEGETVRFTISRDSAVSDFEITVLFGPQGDQVREVWGLSPGESSLALNLETEDDDYDGPDERVYEMTVLPFEHIPEDERAQYWTVEGPSSITVTVTDNDLPLVYVEPVEESYIEGDRGAFRVAREGQTSAPLEVKARVSQTGNSYFEAFQYLLGREETYTFRASEESRVKHFLTELHDGDEDDTSMTMTLLAGEGYRIDPERSSATFTVTDDDPLPTLSVSGATVSEDAGEIEFRVSVSSTLRPPSRRAITVDYTTHNGTAVAGTDYTASSGTLTIRPRATRATITVPVLDDRLVELEQDFTILLSNPVNAVLQDGQEGLAAVGVITDDEPYVAVAAVRDEVDEGDPAVFEFTRTGSVADAMTVYFIAGYEDGRGSWESTEFPAGDSAVRWSFTTDENDLDGPDRTYLAYVIPPMWQHQTLYYDSHHTFVRITVEDDDLPFVTIEADSEGVKEGAAATFTLTREGRSDATLTVNVSVTQTNGSDTETPDFISGVAPATATFAEGSETATLSVPTSDDATTEPHGAISAAIADGDDYRAGEPASGAVDVADDDRRGIANLSISARKSVVEEGEDLVFVVTRTGITSVDLVARVQVVERRAIRVVWPNAIVADRTRNREVRFEPGDLTATLTVPTEDEEVNDGNSRWQARLRLDPGYGIVPYPGVVTVWVRDNDIPTVSFEETEVDHFEMDGTYPVYTLVRTGGTSLGLNVNLTAYRIRRYRPPIPNIVDEFRTPFERIVVAGESSRSYPAELAYVGPLGGTGNFYIEPGHCEEVPGNCGYEPQYHVGEGSVYTVTTHNNAPGVAIEADQASIEEGETVTFTLTRYGGTEKILEQRLDVRLAATQNGEFIQGVTPQTVRFTGWPDVSQSERELTATVTIPTLDDEVYEPDGSITLTILPPDPTSNQHAHYEFEGGGGGEGLAVTVAVADNDVPAISISDAAASEGDAAIEFTVTATASYEKLTVDWATSDGTGANAANAGEDYEAASGQVAFEVGDTSQTISVKLREDGAVEGDETFIVTLSNASGAALTRASAVGTVRDDDTREELTVTAPDRKVEEGETASFTFSRGVEGGGAQSATFGSEPLTVSLTLAQQGDFFKPAEGNFEGAKVDYDEETGTATLTIPGGQRSLTLDLTTDDDSQPEYDGSITLTLAEGSGYVVGRPGSATVDVSDNDVGISVADAAAQDEEKPNMTFTVSLSRAAEETVTVKVDTVDGMATSDAAATATSLGRDFRPGTETLTFNAGETEKEFVVKLVDDAFDEETEEDFTVRLSNPSDNAGLLDDEAVGTILDNDETLEARVYREGRTVNEDAEGPVTFRFELEPQEDSGTTATEYSPSIFWTVTPGTAAAGEDYAAVEGRQTTTFQPGVVSKTVEVDLIDDSLFETLNETFTFRMTGAVYAIYDRDTDPIEIAIRDDEGMRADVVVPFARVSEGDEASFNVVLTQSVSSAPVEVSYTVVGTAGPVDYVAPSGTLIIPAGESLGVVEIATIMDNVLDPDETLGIELTRATSNGREITVPSSSADTVTILDQATLSASVVAGEPADEGDAAEFTVRLSIATDVPVRVDWETSDAEAGQGEAAEGDDYTAGSGAVTIPAGDISATFTVATLEDDLHEGDETFVATLTGAKRGADPDTAEAVALGVSSATGTIADDDARPTGITLAAAPASVSEDAGETTLTVTATLGGSTRLPTDVRVSLNVTGDGAAQADGDDAPDPVTLTIPAEEASGTAMLTFTPADDEVYGEDKQARITGTANGFDVAEAIVTVTDDDDAPTGVTLSVTPGTVGEGDGATDLTVTATLTGGDPQSTDTEVALSVEGVSLPPAQEGDSTTTAAAAGDFTAASGVILTIPAGQRTGAATLAFTPTDDIVEEDDETAQVSGTSDGLEVTPAPLAIEDNDQEPDGIRLSSSLRSVSEDAGSFQTQVTATLTGGGARRTDTTLELSVAGVSATAGDDFTADSTVALTIPAGEMSGVASLSFTLVNDNVHEYTEEVAIRGTNSDPGLPVRGVRVSITDDDPEPTGIVLSVDRSTVSEDGGSQQIQVTAELLGSSLRLSGTLVRLEIANGTASASDYSALANMLTIPAGKGTGTALVVITPIDDSIDEEDETVTIRGTAPLRDLEVEPALVTITDDDTVALALSKTALTVDEGDTTGATYSVKLATQPSEEVTVTISGHAATDLTLDKTTLTFTTENWETAQTVTVKAGQDDDGVDDTVTLTHTASGGEYAGVEAGLSVTVDDDDRGLVLSKSSLTVDEGDATGATYTVKLAAQPSEDVTVTASGHADTDLSLDKTTLTFTTSTWDIAQTVTVKAGQDDDGADDSVTLSHSASGGEYADVTAELPVTVTDDDRGLVLSKTALTMDEGDTTGVSYTVALAVQPTKEVTVTVTGHADTDLTLDKTTLTFTTENWETAQTVTVKAGQDDDGDDDSVTLTHTAAGGEYADVTAEMPVTVSDDDRGIVLSKTALTVDEGDTTGATYTVKLATQPLEEVTVTVSGHSGTDLSLDKATLTFTTSTWDTAQTVTVKAGQDDDGADDPVTLTHTAAGGEYADVTATLPITVTDDDRGLALTPASLTVDEGDTTGATYTVALATQPSEEVTVTVSGHSGTGLTLDKTTLTFTTSTWETAQTVTVKAGQDDDGADDSVTLTHTASGGEYAGVEAGLSVTVDDDETPSLALSKSSLEVDEGDTTGATYTVALATQPSEEVTVTVSGHAGTDLTLDKTTLTFTTSTWGTAQTVTVKAGQDDDGADDTITLTHTASGGEYDDVEVGLSVTVDDDETPSLALSKTALTLDEGDTTGKTYSVKLATQPLEEVTVTVTGHAGTDLTLDKTTLTFTTSTWDTAQTVTVKAGQDDDGADDSVTLTHMASGGEYAGVTEDLSVTVSDDDSVSVSVSFDSDTYSATEGGSNATVTVELSPTSASQVDIPLTATAHDGATPDDWSGVPSSLSFGPGESSMSFTVTAVDDDVEDDGEMVELGFGVLPAGYSPGTPATARVTLMNDDRKLRPVCEDEGIVYTEADVEVDNDGEALRDQDDFISGHTPLLEVGQSLEGYIAECEDIDIFRIEVEDGKYYRIDHLGSSTLDGTLSNPLIFYFLTDGPQSNSYRPGAEPVWYRPSDGKRPYSLDGRNGREIIWVDPDTEPQANWSPSTRGNSKGGEGRNARQYLMKFPAGTYYVGLRERAYGIGTYRVSLTEVVDDYSDIRSINSDERVTGALDFPGDEDTFEVTLDAGVTYVIDAASTSSIWEMSSVPFVNKAVDVGASTVKTYAPPDPQKSVPLLFTPVTTGVHRFTITGKALPSKFADGHYLLAVMEAGPTEPPPPPQNLTAVANSDGSVALSWDAPDDDSVTGYQILRRQPLTDDEQFLPIYVADSCSTETTYRDTNVTSGTPHVYRVKAINTIGRSGQSDSVNVTPLGSRKWDGNAPATCGPTISGTARVGETLTADTSRIADGDRLYNASFSYQWIAEADGTDSVIAGATSSSYTLVAADAGKNIRVRVNFTDAAGHQESLTSQPMGPVDHQVSQQRSNSPATGAPTITGTAQVGQTLTAGTTGISDADGVTNAAHAYQWISSDGTTDTDIAGATSTTYLVRADDVDSMIKVRVSFTDDAGNDESLTSAATSAVSAAVPGAPGSVDVQPEGTGKLAVSWEEPASDGGASVTGYTVQWKETAGSWDSPADVSAATTTETSHTISSLSLGTEYSVRVIATNSVGDGPASAEKSATAVAHTSQQQAGTQNTPATGAPTISGTLEVGQTLSADISAISDADGLDNVSFTYQWRRSDGTTDTDITGATGSTYTLADADEGKAIKVRVSFTDDAGNEESLTSAPIAPDWPYGLTAAVSDGAVVLTWKPPVGQSYMFDYQILRNRPELGEAEPLVYIEYTYTEETAYTDTDVEPGVLYVYRVKAVVDVFGRLGEASEPVEIRTAEPTPGENSPATGAPTIGGTSQVGETLTADTSGIADRDGLDNVSFSYQWLADAAYIAGATGSSYTLVAADAGKAIKVRVSFTDDAGNEESLTSAGTSAVAAAPTPLTAQFLDTPPSHDGQTDFTFELRFSEEFDLSYVTLRDHAFTVTGGEVTGARRLDRPSNIRWEITVRPDGNGEVFVALPATEDCGDQGAICTGDGRKLSNRTELTAQVPVPANSAATGAPTIGGTSQVGETLAADTSGIADGDGLDNVSFSYQWVADDTDIAGATGSSYTLADSDAGKAIKVRVSFTDDEGNEESLTSAATSAVAAAPTPLTARFLDTPSSHDGQTAFTFELRFSEEFDLSYVTLRDHAFTVTGGEVTEARRLDKPGNIRWEITVRPDGNGDVTVVLPATEDCEDQGAICTGDGRRLSTEMTLTVAGPGG